VDERRKKKCRASRNERKKFANRKKKGRKELGVRQEGEGRSGNERSVYVRGGIVVKKEGPD